MYKSKYLENTNYIKELSKKFIFDNTVNCGCEDYSTINGKKISNYYLTVADTHLNFSKNVDFKKLNSFFEIGGGFGANVHFLLQNYSNIKMHNGGPRLGRTTTNWVLLQPTGSYYNPKPFKSL